VTGPFLKGSVSVLGITTTATESDRTGVGEEQVSVIDLFYRLAGLSFILRVLGALLVVVMHVVISRAIGSRGYGVFSFALATANLVAAFAPMGWSLATVRLLAEYYALSDWAHYRGVLRMSLQVTLGVAVVAAVVVWLIGQAGISSPDLVVGLKYGSLLIPILAVTHIRRAFYRSVFRPDLSLLPNDIILPILMTGIVFLATPSQPEQALSIYAGLAFLVLVLSLLYFLRLLPAGARGTSPALPKVEWFHVALPMFLGGLSHSVLNRSDMVMLGALSDGGSLGLYAASYRIAVLNVFTLNSVIVVAAPMFAASNANNDMRSLRRLLFNSTLCSALISLPLFGLMYVFPGHLLSLFGQEFDSGSALLRILALGQYAAAATGPAGTLLLMMGRERTYAKLTATMAVVNVLGNAVAIPYWGAIGAASVTTATLATWRLSMAVLAWRHLSNSGIEEKI
jgi:O-antigen/teichoic acid export membrane protein